MTLLKDIVSIEKGKKHNLLDEYQEGAIRVFQANDFRNEDKPLYTLDKDGLLANEDDILLVWDGSVGQISFGKNGYVGSTMVKLKVKNKKEYSPFFIYKFLQTKSHYLKRKATGATIMHINRKSLEQLVIPLIKFSNQLYIANVLSKAEQLIIKRKESIRLLDEFLKNLFGNMFISNAASQNWEEVSFANVADNKRNSMRTGPFGSSMLHSEFRDTGDVKVLGIDNVVSNKFEWKRDRCISFQKFQVLKRYQVFPEDVLISIMATLGRTAVVPFDIPISINSKHLAAITLNKKIANPYFIAFAFHSHPTILKQLRINTKGAIMDGLNLTIIKKIKFRLPPVELQNQFAQIVEKKEALKTQHQQSLQELENLSGALTQKAFKGELFKKEKAKIISLITNEIEEKALFKRAVLAAYIINKSLNDLFFGDVKFQKLMHLSEYHIIKRNFKQSYFQKAAGPYDNKFIHWFWNYIDKQKWFIRRKKGAQFFFKSGSKHANSLNTYNYFSTEELERVDELISYFKKADYEKPEIISTLYAVWNNRIILQQPVNDGSIKNDFLQWDSKKIKYKDRLDNALKWMKQKGIVPDGWGNVITKTF